MATIEYTRHPLSFAFPETKDADGFSQLIYSMRVNGYMDSHPILLFEGQILDGWNRYRAAKITGIEPIYRHFTGTERDALNFVETENSARRHMSKVQQAYALLRIDMLRTESERRTPEEVASITGTSIANVRNAIGMFHDDPELADMVVHGEKKAETAMREMGKRLTSTSHPGFVKLSLKRLSKLEEIAVETGKTPQRILGLAVDAYNPVK